MNLRVRLSPTKGSVVAFVVVNLIDPLVIEGSRDKVTITLGLYLRGLTVLLDVGFVTYAI